MRGDRRNESFCEAHDTKSKSEGLNGATQRVRKPFKQNRSRDLTDKQWSILDILIPEPTARGDRRGRPWKSRRSVLNGILWVLRTGAPWSALPERYPSYQTCHRRFQQWVRSGIMRGVLEALAGDLRLRGRLDVRESFIDGSFVPAKKGDRRSAKQNVAKERRSWPWQTAMAYLLPYASKAPRPMK
jgi:transposase